MQQIDDHQIYAEHRQKRNDCFRNNIEISVCIPVYKVEKYIAQCLESVFNQTIIDKAEVILINDCTPDNSIAIAEEIIEKFPSVKGRVRIINHEVNKGLAAARNTGLENANGKYIICLDSDDWVEPTYLEGLYNAAEREAADIAGCDYFAESKAGQKIIKEDLSNPSAVCLKHILSICQGIIWTKLIRKSLFTENGIRWEEGLDMGEDLLICAKLFSVARKTASTGTPLHHYRLTNENSMCNDNSIIGRKNAQLIAVVKRIDELLAPLGIYETEINLLKLGIKKILVFSNKDKSIRSELYRLFPESKHCLAKAAFSKKERMVMFLISNNFYGLANLIFWIKGR